MDKASLEQVFERLSSLVSTQTDPKIRLLSLRGILERLYKDLCSDSATVFSGLFARMQYIHEKWDISRDLDYQANHLRILCNKAAHDDMKDGFEEAFDSGILVLGRLFEFFYKEALPSDLKDYLGSREVKDFKKRADSAKQSFQAVISSWKKKESAIDIMAISEQGERINIFLKDDLKCGSEGRLYSNLDKMLWENSTVSFHELSQSPHNSSSFTSNPLTMVVIEPDFLIDATSIAECMQDQSSQPQFYIISRLLSEPMNQSMMQGSLVNELFDRMVINPQLEWEALEKELGTIHPIQYCALGQEVVSQVTQSIKMNHYPQLKSFVESLNADEIHLEPSFICPRYGLQGRLDLLSQKDGKASIIELKSGKAPKTDTWRSQQMQVTAYNMIIRSVFGSRNHLISSILYSSDPEQPLRNVENHILREQELMYCRNRIVGILHQLANDPEPFCTWLRDSSITYKNQIFAGKATKVRNILRSIKEHEYEWFLEQLKAIVKEIWAVKLGSNESDRPGSRAHSSLWLDDAVSKLDSYQLLQNLSLKGQDGNLIVLEQAGVEDVSDFREGDVVVLYSQDRSIDKQQLLRGSIKSVSGSIIEIRIRGGLSGQALNGRELKWSLEHDVLDSLLYTPLSSVFSFLSAKSESRDQLLGLSTPLKAVHVQSFGSDIDSVVSQISGEAAYYVIQGPPGTGKTSGLLKSYLKQLYETSTKRILVLSFTNRAVDEICYCLDSIPLPYIRTGQSQSVEENLLSKIVEGKTHQEITALLGSNRIWLSTVQSANAWLKDALEFTGFDELIVDEASQIVESSILGLVSSFKKTILIGDQNQLPPIISQSRSAYTFGNSLFKELCFDDYQRSLMERLHLRCRNKGWEGAINMLKTHYRMHDDIAGLVAHYYDGQLVGAGGRQSEDLVINDDKMLHWLNYRIVWIDFPPTSTARYDASQATAIKTIAEVLVKHGVIHDPATELGIIAPFRAMSKCIRSMMESSFQGITIDTVERFQGSQRKVILLCLPLRDKSELRCLESLSSDGSIDRKLNVAISRASERLIILGNSRICSASTHYRKLVDKIQAKHLLVTNQEFDSYMNKGV